jgi:N,N'-diacetyllegionaminate synthase
VIRTLVIAEPGGTAEGDFDAMCELIRVAADCGADAWKPQWVSSAEAHLQRRSANLSADERDAFFATYARAYQWLQWPLEWHRELAWRTHNLGMEYIVSVCLPQDVWSLAPYVDRFKISSFEADDRQLGCTARATEKPVLISAGMNHDGTVYGRGRLHCVSAYPTPLDQANLSAIQAYSMDGYSDHTRHVIAGSQAVAYGATVVEAHYRLDACSPANPDYVVAFSPAEFAQYVRYVRDAEVMRGTGRKIIQPCEAPMLRYKVSA